MPPSYLVIGSKCVEQMVVSTSSVPERPYRHNHFPEVGTRCAWVRRSRSCYPTEDG